ncbi:MAG: hypothetical protein LR015_11540 [Verrucomicrobia bacterium]|nr:hypothetical protein [Verrucomicrobiota bacterium]
MPKLKRGLLPLAGASLLTIGSFTGCIHVKTDPIRIEPIYINITINHKIQRELDDIFAALDRQSAATEYIPLEEK